MQADRAKTPPPRRQGKAGDPLTSSPAARPRARPIDLSRVGKRRMLPAVEKPKSDSEHAFELPKSTGATSVAPSQVDEDVCFSTPKSARSREDSYATLLSRSPGCGKEDRVPGAHAQTPQSLPTVLEDGGLPGVNENRSLPVWVIQSPVRALRVGDDESLEERAKTMHKMGLLSSPTPPGLEQLPVKNTFIQFESPHRMAGMRSPPKTEPRHFAPLPSKERPIPEMHEICNSWFTDLQVPSLPGQDYVTCEALKRSFDAAYSAGWHHQMANEIVSPLGDLTASTGQTDQLNALSTVQPSQQRGTPVKVVDALPNLAVQVEEQPRQPGPQKAVLRISDYMPEGAQKESQVRTPSARTVMPPPCPTVTEPNVLAGGGIRGLTDQHVPRQQCESHPMHPQMAQSLPPMHMQTMNEPHIMPQLTTGMPVHMQQQQQLAADMQYTQQQFQIGPDPSPLQPMQCMPPFVQIPQAQPLQQFQHTFNQV